MYFMDLAKNHEYTCNSENNFQNIAISSFFISQRAVKSWIIANIHEIIISQEYFLYFERKTSKFKPKKGHFVGKWPYLQILSIKCRI